MNTARTGKIARLPALIRHQVNLRLRDGEPGPKLLRWLNRLPEVKAVLAADFAGKRISPQNLSEWRHGGYQDWLLRQDTLEVTRDLYEKTPAPAGDLARLAGIRYFVEIEQLNELEGPEHWRKLRQLCQDISRLRRAEQASARLDLDLRRLALTQLKSQT